MLKLLKFKHFKIQFSIIEDEENQEIRALLLFVNQWKII